MQTSVFEIQTELPTKIGNYLWRLQEGHKWEEVLVVYGGVDSFWDRQFDTELYGVVSGCDPIRIADWDRDSWVGCIGE